MVWSNAEKIKPHQYDCGHCGNRVASVVGFHDVAQHRSSNQYIAAYIAVCPSCEEPTYFKSGKQLPGVRPGATVENLPKDIEAAYNEARDCMAVSAYSAAAMLCRKLLMYIAAAQGAPGNQTFKAYVEYLSDKGYVPPGGKEWVDHIRDKGNEANHELVFMSQTDASDLIGFAEMLLKFIYEFPMKVGAKKPP